MFFEIFIIFLNGQFKLCLHPLMNDLQMLKLKPKRCGDIFKHLLTNHTLKSNIYLISISVFKKVQLIKFTDFMIYNLFYVHEASFSFRKHI
jgi:hypothetical protein